ncbi:MAG: hypothetical protein LBI26_02575, partial [Holosporales bacterium]|nr:hypothetical protein [Holosporales bacterium]
MNKYSKIIYVSSIFLGMCSSDGYGTVNTAYLAKVSDISNVIAAIQTLSVQVTAINTAMSTSMVQGLSGLTGEGGVITQLRDNIQSLLDVANLPDAISNFLNSGDMTTLSNLITGLTEEGGIIPTLSNLITDLTEGGGIIPTLTGQITGLTEEGGVIPTLTGQITGLTGDEGDISNLSTSINGILTLLNTLSEQIQGLSGDIDLPTTSSITTAMGTAGFATVTDVTNAIAALTDEGGPITSISEAIDALTDPTTGPITSISEAIDALTDPTTGPITNISEAIDALTDPTTGPITNISEAIDAL